MLCGWLSVLSMVSLTGWPTWTAKFVTVKASWSLPSGPLLLDGMTFNLTVVGIADPVDAPDAAVPGAVIPGRFIAVVPAIVTFAAGRLSVSARITAQATAVVARSPRAPKNSTVSLLLKEAIPAAVDCSAPGVY
jgi:hypothetical protein